MIKKRIKQSIAAFLLFVASLVILLYSKAKIDNMDIEYEEVNVTVISAKAEKAFSSRYNTNYKYYVVVEYEDVKYDLINVQSGEMPKYEGLANLPEKLQHNNPYFDNTVYYSNGKMYSNIAGIKTDCKDFNWYMVGLAGTFIFGLVALICIADMLDKKKKLKQEKEI